MNPKSVLQNEIGRYWTLKKSSLGPPSIYLGNKVSEVILENGTKAWSFSSSQYVQEAIKNVELHLRKTNEKLPSFAAYPLTLNYRPEVDIYVELDPTEASYY